MCPEAAGIRATRASVYIFGDVYDDHWRHTVDPRKWMTTLETKTKRGGDVERGKIQSNLDNSNLEGEVQISELRKFRPIELFVQQSFTKQIWPLK